MNRSFADEFETLAERCAHEGMAGRGVARLAIAIFPMSLAARDELECDPDYFACRVNDYAYAAAMRGAEE